MIGCRSLGELIARLERNGELQRIGVAVDPVLELAAITSRACTDERTNRGLLFESVQGSDFPAATNLFGSGRRLALALGIDQLADLTPWLDRILEQFSGATSLERLSALAGSSLWQDHAPVTTAAAPCREVVAPTNLGILPFPKVWPHDGEPEHGGRFITLPLVITANPDSGNINCGMYRCALLGPDRLAIPWSSSSGGADHAARWQLRNEPMPIVIALGGPPSLTFAAMLPLPDYLDEFTFAGLLGQEPLTIFTCANGLPAPAEAELVMEGYLEKQPAASGAFGNHTGYYTPSGPGGAVRITAMYHRREMICPATVVGKPPMEDCYLAEAAGHLLLSLLKIDVPEATALHRPYGGIFHNAAIISVRNVRGRGQELISRIRSTPWFNRARLLLLVEGEEPSNLDSVYWRVMNTVDWERDLLVDGNLLSIDATLKPSEQRRPVTMDRDLAALVEQRWQEYGF